MRRFMVLMGCFVIGVLATVAQWDLPIPIEPPGNGFENPVDITDLPVYAQWPTGWIATCDWSTADEPPSKEPLLWAERTIASGWELCLVNSPAVFGEDGREDFTVRLTAPDGELEFSEHFVWGDDVPVGETSGSEWYGGPELWVLGLRFPADLPGGEWTVSLLVDDVELVSSVINADMEPKLFYGPGVYNIQRPGHESRPFLQRIPLPDAESFTGYGPGDTFNIVGRNFTPGDTITIALYLYEEVPNPEDYYDHEMIGIPQYATEVTVDAAGRFVVPFTVREDTPPSENYVLLLDTMLVPDEAFLDSDIPWFVFWMPRIWIAAE